MRSTRIVCVALALGLCRLGLSAGAPAGDLGAALAKSDLADLQQKLAAELRKQIPSPTVAAASVAEPTIAGKLAVWRLICVIGSEDLAKVRALPEGRAFFVWLGRHPEAVEDYLSSGDPREYNADGLGVWERIWAERPESREGVLLRLAESTALTFAMPLSYMADGKPIDPLVRYAFFEKSYRDGALFPYFQTARTWELRYVVGSWAREEDMEWVRGKVGAGEKNQARIGEACWMVPYRDKNAKGVSVQAGAKYYDYKPMTLKLMVEVGGVCGAISRFGTSACQAFGIPAMPVTQPGHCAHVWRDKEGSWHVGQDIFGWAQSGEHDPVRILFGARPTYVLLVDAATADPKAFAASQRLWWASGLASRTKIQALATAVSADPLDYPVVRAYLAAAKPEAKADEFIDLLQKVGRPLRDNPYALCDLLQNQMDGLLTSLTANGKTRELVEGVLQAIADGDPAKQVGCAARARAFFLGTAVRVVTKRQEDFESPIRDGQDAGKLWDKLDMGSRMEWQRAIELAVRTGMKRKDLYEQPLNLYAAILSQDKTASVRGIPYLGGLARQALKAGVAPFGADACAKLADLCDKAGDKAAADEWRRSARP